MKGRLRLCYRFGLWKQSHLQVNIHYFFPGPPSCFHEINPERLTITAIPTTLDPALKNQLEVLPLDLKKRTPGYTYFLGSFKYVVLSTLALAAAGTLAELSARDFPSPHFQQ